MKKKWEIIWIVINIIIFVVETMEINENLYIDLDKERKIYHGSASGRIIK